MILPAESRHIEEIISLWSGAFGDKAEDVEKYLETILEYFFVYEEDGVLKGMLSVLPVSFCEKNGGYIYAVVTDEKYRGQGICGKFMDFVKADENCDFLVLKPQNEGLIGFYEKMGFKKVPQLDKGKIRVTGQGKNEYKLKSLSEQDYEKARNTYFGEEIIKWNSNMLSFAKDMYSGGFYAVEEKGENIAFAFAFKDKNVAVIKELLAKEPEKVANFIAETFECENAEFAICSSNGKDGYMIYPKEMKKGYFNIYLD